MGAAQRVVASEAVSAALFALVAIAAFAFGLFMAAQASLDTSYLRTLRWALAFLSVGFSAALAYETVALATHRTPTISIIIEGAFRTHPIVWVIVFGIMMGLAGALALHFTRVAAVSTGVVAAQRAFDATAHPLIWAIALGLAIILAALLVSRLTPIIIRAGDPGFNWWVVILGGALYGIGAIAAWITDWRP